MYMLNTKFFYMSQTNYDLTTINTLKTAIFKDETIDDCNASLDEMFFEIIESEMSDDQKVRSKLITSYFQLKRLIKVLKHKMHPDHVKSIDVTSLF